MCLGIRSCHCRLAFQLVSQSQVCVGGGGILVGSGWGVYGEGQDG